VATNYGDNGFRWVLLASDILHEGFGSNDVQSSDTEKALWVEFASLLHDFRSDGDSGVDWVRDNQDESLGAIIRDALNKITDDACIDFEEIIAGHAWLSYSPISFAPFTMCRVHQLGIPAGMSTTSAPVKAFFNPSSAGK